MTGYNTWGVSWGVSWGLSWGAGSSPTPSVIPPSSGSGKGKFKTANDNKDILSKSRKRYVETITKITNEKSLELETDKKSKIKQESKKSVETKIIYKNQQYIFPHTQQKLGKINEIKEELDKLQLSISGAIVLRKKEEEEIFFLLAMALC